MASACRASILNNGPHGLTEIVYAFASMGNNNGSAFAGLVTATGWYNLAGGGMMLVARFAPQIFVLALAGSAPRGWGPAFPGQRLSPGSGGFSPVTNRRKS